MSGSFSLQAQNRASVNKMGGKTLIQEIRYEWSLEEKDEEGKLNNKMRHVSVALSLYMKKLILSKMFILYNLVLLNSVLFLTLSVLIYFVVNLIAN